MPVKPWTTHAESWRAVKRFTAPWFYPSGQPPLRPTNSVEDRPEGVTTPSKLSYVATSGD